MNFKTNMNIKVPFNVYIDFSDELAGISDKNTEIINFETNFINSSVEGQFKVLVKSKHTFKEGIIYILSSFTLNEFYAYDCCISEDSFSGNLFIEDFSADFDIYTLSNSVLKKELTDPSGGKIKAMFKFKKSY